MAGCFVLNGFRESDVDAATTPNGKAIRFIEEFTQKPRGSTDAIGNGTQASIDAFQRQAAKNQSAKFHSWR
jgi:hypothetical protein